MPQSDYPSPHASQRGAAALSFLLTALPVLMLGLGGIELHNWLWVRQVLGHALLEAGRAASVDHARPDTIVAEFEHALRPLYLKPGSLRHALARRSHDIGQAPWQIRIRAPVRTAFLDHAASGLKAAGIPAGLQTINHDYQALQHQQRLAQGWPEGKGPASGQTIFEANTLDIELIWAHEPLIPGVRTLMRAFGAGVSDYRGRVYAQGYLPMLRRLTLTMQSHPVAWPDRADGKVVHGARSHLPTPEVVKCSGFWAECGTPSNTGHIDPPMIPPVDGLTPPEAGSPGTPPAMDGIDPGSGTIGDQAGGTPGAGDPPACGLHLCC
ncbi:MAG: hypothetical protein L0H54_04355 [Alcaligenaceae bacterium]|nr:hypothetical protein [Alcaligenaceae bacterium]